MSESENIGGTEDCDTGEIHAEGPPNSYRHDPSWVPVLARAADAACDGVTDPHEAALQVETIVRQADLDVHQHAAKMLFHTFMYVIIAAPVAEHANAALEPLKGPSLLPLALSDANDDLRRLWVELAPAVQHPVARARCWDIVFTLGLVRNRRDAALQAVRAYIDAAGTTLSRQNKATGLLRAWTMARLVKLIDQTDEIAKALLAVAEEAVAAQEDPYAAITALSALVARPPRRVPPAADTRIDDLLERGLTTYPQVHIIRDFAVLVRKRAGNDAHRVEKASRHEVEAMLAEADAATDPMITRTLFSDADGAARRLGLNDLERVAVGRLQGAPPVAWSSSEYSITIPAPFFDYFLPGLLTADDWRQALAIWLHSRPPTGDRQANEARARHATRTSFLYRIAGVTLFRDGDLPARRVRGDDEIFNRELVRVESYHMAQNGRLLAKGLHQIGSGMGFPLATTSLRFSLMHLAHRQRSQGPWRRQCSSSGSGSMTRVLTWSFPRSRQRREHCCLN